MKIVADENIPLVADVFNSIGEVTLLPGREISPQDVNDADLLLVRSVTPVNQALLANSSLRFVGTATTGLDHIDQTYLQQAGIAFASAEGCNTVAVAEYVVSCIASLRQKNFLQGKKLRAGVIGLGKVGTEVAKHLRILGFEVLENDPPRAIRDPHFISTPLKDFSDLDLICIHTPLEMAGDFPSFHLINAELLKKQKDGCVLINAGRGSVIDSADLAYFGHHLIWCLDVWENEPEIDLALLKRALIATPHIAGYTCEAKLRAVTMLYQAVQKFLNVGLPASALNVPRIALEAKSWEEAVLKNYDPLRDTVRTQAALLAQGINVKRRFDELRKDYPPRHEFASVEIKNGNQLSFDDQNRLLNLGFIIK